MKIEPPPFRSLASIACTEERIRNRVTPAHVADVDTGGSRIRIPRLQRINGKSCKRYDTTRPNTQDKHSQPPLQVDIKYAATKHGCWLRLLKVWTSRPGQSSKGSPQNYTVKLHSFSVRQAAGSNPEHKLEQPQNQERVVQKQECEQLGGAVVTWD